MDSEGRWSACGDHAYSDSEAERDARGYLEDSELVDVRWVEADIPLPVRPEPQTVEGEVKP
jgi:hypothetical protein